MNKKTHHLLFLLIFIGAQLMGQEALNRTPIPDYTDELNAYSNHLDSFIINLYYSELIKASAEEKTPNKAYSEAELDSMYKRGLEILDAQSPFSLEYNKYTSAFINLYVNRRPSLTQNCMALSRYYFPVFEEYLDKYDLPLEFKYLAIVESALNIKARSRAGAAGLWQFMYRTGVVYGLEVNSYIDERHELYASTDAACRYFKDLYEVYGNWELVIAAYNCGPGNVNKAIRRSGGKRTYWEIRSWLPRETRGYVPAFIAVNYAMNFGGQHGLHPTNIDSLDLITDTIHTKGPIDMRLMSQYFCADFNHLAYLNPEYKLGMIPEDNKSYVLRIPLPLTNAYLAERALFEQYASGPETPAETVSTPPTPSQPTGSRQIHTVKSGEVLGVIAEKYGVGLSRVKDWNNLYSSRIYEGQKLVIYSDKAITKEVLGTPSVKPAAQENPDYRYHTVKSGDTLWDIAKMYDGLTVTELKRLNKGLDHQRLKPGSRIIVSTNS
ncbi:MAG: LysM peptidoglycan-binding domain-containing protein [Vicingaceae bacterium]